MPERFCITCESPYGERHRKDCPAYIIPKFDLKMIKQFIKSNCKKTVNPKNGEIQNALFVSDLDALEERFYK